MSESIPKIEYAESFDSLGQILQNVKAPGAFAVSGRLETAMPDLRVEGVGRIAFPVLPQQSVELIEKVAAKAPYGRGAETVLDESVRKVWQIPSEKVFLQGSKWEATMKKLAKIVGDGFGLEEGSFFLELYKLLIYDQGGFFAAHRDSEKAGGMFGTLVVTLPSEHEGGELQVRHCGQEKQFDLRCEDAEEICYAAFYADCEHEVLPVISGYRICLIFNLVAAKKIQIAAPAFCDFSEEIAGAAKILGAWSERQPETKKLVYILSHHYTQSALSFDSLKGEDALVAEILKSAAKKAGCEIYLGMVHIEEHGYAEYGDFDSYDSDDFEEGEVYDRFHSIDQWRDDRDCPVGFGKISLHPGEALPVGALDDEEPDEQHFYGSTGNEGATFDRTYLRAALIFWPPQNADEILIGTGNVAAAGYLAKKIGDFLRAGHSGDKESIRRVARLLAQRWIIGGDSDSNVEAFGELLDSLNQLGDGDLWMEVVAPILPEEYCGAHNQILVGSYRLFGEHPGFADAVAGLFRDADVRNLPNLMDLWVKLVKEEAVELAEVALVGLLPSLKAEKIKRGWHRFFSIERMGQKGEKRVLVFNLQNEIERIDVTLFLEFIRSLSDSGLQKYASTFFESIFSDTGYFIPEDLIVPALEMQESSGWRLEFSLAPLWEHSARYFLDRSEVAASEPKDWALDVVVRGTSPLIRELEIFAKDPVLKEYRFRVKQEYRNEIMGVVKQYNMDIDCVEERKGSPYTLVCRKNRKTYQLACEQYERDIACMKRLLGLRLVGECEGGLRQRLVDAVK